MKKSVKSVVGGKGEILIRANIIKIALLGIIVTAFFTSPLYAEPKSLQLDNRPTKNISRSSRSSRKNNFNLLPSLAAPRVKITPVKIAAPLVPKINVSAPTIKTITPLVPKLNHRITPIPVAKISNFKAAVSLAPVVPKLNTLTPKAVKMNLTPVLKANIPMVAPIKNSVPKVNFKPAQTIKLIPQQNYPARLPRRSQAIPLANIPARQSQPVVPMQPLSPVAPAVPVSQPAGNSNAASNTNSNNSGHNHGGSGVPFSMPLILGLFGHFPNRSRKRLHKMLVEVFRRLKNGIGITFGARSPNISGVDECNLACVHQEQTEEKPEQEMTGSQEDCGHFCLYEDKKATANQPKVKIEALNGQKGVNIWAY